MRGQIGRWGMAVFVIIALQFSLGSLLAKKKRRRKRRKKKVTRKVVLRTLPVTRFAAELGRLPFDKGKSSVQGYLTAVITARFAAKIKKTQDSLERDKLKTQRDALLKKISTGYTEFKGQNTGFEVTNIARDYKHSTGETMFNWTDGRMQKYYFLFKNRFYKALWSYNDSEYKRVVAKLTAALGKPTVSKKLMTWKGRKILVELRDERVEFASLSLVISYRLIHDNLASLRTGGGNLQRKMPDVTNTVKHLTTDAPKKKKKPDIVDQLTGKKHKIDYNLGKKKIHPGQKNDDDDK